jgi:two-component system, chemotaxis family, chemotaxis protein CheY
MLEPGNLATSNNINAAEIGARPRLLAIEDDTLHRMMICRVAANAGYVPAGAATYDEAVKLLQKDTFDCVTLELTLGGRDGNEVLRHLAAIGYSAHIIIVSADDDTKCQDSLKLAQSLDLNVWEAIAKPVDLVELRCWLEWLKPESAAAPVAA